MIATAIWGSTWLGIKYQLGTVAPEVSVAYRFALAAILLASWCRATGRSLRFPLREHAWLAALGATLFGFNYVGIYWSERYITSGLVAVLFSTIVFMNPVGMRLAFATPLSTRTFLAATLGVTGVALLFLPEIEQTSRGASAGLGVIVALSATLVASVGNLIAIRNQKAGMALFPSTAWGMAYGAAAAALTAFASGVAWSFDARAPYVVSLLYLAVFGSVVAFGAYLTLLKRVGGGPAAYVAVSTPVLALALSTVFENYRWTWTALLGVVLAVAGNWLALQAANAGASHFSGRAPPTRRPG